MTENENQNKRIAFYGIETQEMLHDRTVEPELKNAKILSMGYITNQDTTKRKNTI